MSKKNLWAYDNTSAASNFPAKKKEIIIKKLVIKKVLSDQLSLKDENELEPVVEP